MTDKKFRILALVSMAPALLWPLALMHTDHLDTVTDRFIMVALPFYCISTGCLAEYVHRDRPTLSWVLLAVLWLSYAAIAAFVLLP